jgi:hypothetical protein
MLDRSQLQQAVSEITPASHQHQVEELVSLLLNLSEKHDYDLLQLLQEIAGKKISVGQSTISFGEGSQVGDVQIRDVAQGNITRFALHHSNSTSQNNRSARTFSQSIGHAINVQGNENSTITVDASTKITNILRKQPFLLYSVLVLALVGLLSIMWGALNLTALRQTFAISPTALTVNALAQPTTVTVDTQPQPTVTVSPGQSIIGVWRVDSIVYGYGPGEVNEEYWEFKEDGSVLIGGIAGHYTLLDGGNKIQIGASVGSRAINFIADASIEEQALNLKNITYSVGDSGVWSMKEVMLSKAN